MRSKQHTARLEAALANKIVALLQNPGWAAVLSEMFCLFGTDLKAELTPTGIRITYVDLDNELIDFQVPMLGEHAANVTFVGRHYWHTLQLEWQDPWDDELTVVRNLTFVNDTLRMIEEKRNAQAVIDADRSFRAMMQAAGLTKTPQA